MSPPRRLRAAFRRCDRAAELTAQADAVLSGKASLAASDPQRAAMSCAAMSLHTRAAAWRALAGGDLDEARILRAEAHWSARAHRSLTRERADAVPAGA